MIIEQMSRELGVPRKFIVNLARGASHEYKYYQIPKRGGGIRAIYHPSRRLKGLQRWLLDIAGAVVFLILYFGLFFLERPYGVVHIGGMLALGLLYQPS